MLRHRPRLSSTNMVHLVYPIVQKGVESDQAIHMLSSGFNVASISICIKDLRGNPKPRVSPDRTGPDRTETGPGSGNILKNIFGSGRVILFRVGPGRGIFLPGYMTFSPGISGINLPIIPKLRK